MIDGGDCRGLLKPIQFQDLASHFLSFMAHLMNSRYQLTCFIIVKTLIEAVFLRKTTMEEKKDQKLLNYAFFLKNFFPCAQNCSASGSHDLATQRLADLANLSPHSPFTVLGLHLPCLIFCLFVPFLVQMVKVVERCPLEKVFKLFLQTSFKAHLSEACVESIKLFPGYLKPGVG